MLKGASYTGGATLRDGTVSAPGLAFTLAPSTGVYRSGGSLGVAVGGGAAATFDAPASAVNFWNIRGNTTGNAPILLAAGSDTDVSTVFVTKGAGVHFFSTNASAGNAQFSVGHVASAVNYVQVLGAAAGGVVQIAAAGSDANPGLALVAKGTGALMAQVPTSTSAGGNARGANAVDWQQSRGGATQVASGQGAVIGGGGSNTASGQEATVAGGASSVASGLRAAVAGGFGNIADNTAAWCPGGYQAVARGTFGRGFWGSGRFTTSGDAQAGEFVLRRQTTDATVTVLTTDGAAPGGANQVILPNSSSYMVRALLIARQTGGAAGTAGDTAAWDVVVTIKRGASAAATAMVGSGGTAAAGQGDAGTTAWRATWAADTTNGALAISVTGEASKNINWVARVLSVEAVG